MTARSIRRAQERKARKQMERTARKQIERKANNAAPTVESIPNALESIPDAEPPSAPSSQPAIPTEAKTISQAALHANRANAQLSTGPTSSQGKAKASMNAVKTALTGRTVLLPSDHAAEYERHVQAFAAEHSPVGPRESDLVQSIADTWWRMKRIPCLESALFALGHLELADSEFAEHDPSLRPSLIEAQIFLKYEKQLRNLQLQEARLFRRYEKDRAELRHLQQQRSESETQALHIVAARYQVAAEENQPFEPTANGFEFSVEEIEQHLETIRARSAAGNHPRHSTKFRVQAA